MIANSKEMKKMGMKIDGRNREQEGMKIDEGGKGIKQMEE